MRGDVGGRVEIGPYGYDIRYTDKIYDGEGRALYAQIDYTGGEVLLLDGIQGSDREAVALWHEVLHGILDACGYDGDVEGSIRALSPGIVSVLRANRWLGGL